MSESDWACITELGSHQLRRGSWHPVLDASHFDVVVLEVNGAPMEVPRACVALHPERRVSWSVVRETEENPLLGPLYGVCPCCLARAPLMGDEPQLPCPSCGFVFPVEWPLGLGPAPGEPGQGGSGNPSGLPALTTSPRVHQEVARGKAYYLMLLSEGPRKRDNRNTLAKRFSEHLEYLLELRSSGRLLLHGPVENGGLRGVAIFAAASADEVRRHMEADPMVEAGFLTFKVYPMMGLPGDGLS